MSTSLAVVVVPSRQWVVSVGSGGTWWPPPRRPPDVLVGRKDGSGVFNWCPPPHPLQLPVRRRVGTEEVRWGQIWSEVIFTAAGRCHCDNGDEGEEETRASR